jgi:hypothetical protein
MGDQEGEKLKHGGVSLDSHTVDPVDHFGKRASPVKI